MRILLVSSYPPRRCGIGSYARDQVARLRAAGDQVMVLSPPDGDGDLRVPFVGGAAFRRAARIGRRFDRSLVHFQPALYFAPRSPASKVLTSASLVWLTVALRRHRLEIVVHEADRPVGWRRWRPDYLLLGLAFRLAPRVVFHTAAERDALERDYRTRVRAAFVPHHVDPIPAVEGVSRQEARARLGIADGEGPVFVCAGFLQASKGFDRALHAFSLVAPVEGGAVASGAGPGPSLYLVGSVRDETPANRAHADRLRARCDEVPGAHLVERFLPDDEFDLWVIAADRIVLPYRVSWSSGLLARAHALGTGAIVTATGGLPEQAGKDDVVVRTDEGLATAMRDVAMAWEVAR